MDQEHNHPDRAPPLVPTLDDLRNDLDMPLLDLQSAARGGQDLAYHLSGAFDAIIRRALGRRPLADCDRDALLTALTAARTSAMCLLPPNYPRDRLVAGFGALSALVVRWNQKETERQRYPEGVVADLRAWVRIVQNDMHNLSLLDEVAERAKGRAAGEKPNAQTSR